MNFSVLKESNEKLKDEKSFLNDTIEAPLESTSKMINADSQIQEDISGKFNQINGFYPSENNYQ